MSADTTMMRAMHDAFRRDLENLARLAHQPWTRQRPAQLLLDWAVFTHQLHLHHTAEDEDLWPVLRTHLEGRGDELALLDAMEAEHAVLDPLLDALATAVRAPEPGPAEVRERVDALRDALVSHLAHEEAEALPLIGRTVTDAEWRRFSAIQKRRNGVRGAAELFPWLLEGVPAERAEEVMSRFPGPVRLAYRRWWLPRYARSPHWVSAARSAAVTR